MELSKINAIDNNMSMQNKYVKEILDLMDECEKGGYLQGISEAELKQLREHCEDIAKAANTAKKLVANIKPAAEEEDSRKKAEKKAEEDAKKKEAAAKKRAETKAAKKAEAEKAAETEDDDLDFLG